MLSLTDRCARMINDIYITRHWIKSAALLLTPCRQKREKSRGVTVHKSWRNNTHRLWSHRSVHIQQAQTHTYTHMGKHRNFVSVCLQRASTCCVTVMWVCKVGECACRFWISKCSCILCGHCSKVQSVFLICSYVQVLHSCPFVLGWSFIFTLLLEGIWEVYVWDHRCPTQHGVFCKMYITFTNSQHLSYKVMSSPHYWAGMHYKHLNWSIIPNFPKGI